MDLHVYRNSQDRWHDLRSAARERGAILAINAVTLDELVERITPDVKTATAGQRLLILDRALRDTSAAVGEARARQREAVIEDRRYSVQGIARYAYDAIGELKGAEVGPADLHAAGEPLLGSILKKYDEGLRAAGIIDPQDRRILAASRVMEGGVEWVKRFSRIVLHALYDLTQTEFNLARSIIELLPDGGAVVLFNTTTNVKPTQFAEWTWQRFIRDESLAEKTFPEFCRSSHQTRTVLDRLFLFEQGTPLPPDNSIRIIEASGRYNEIEIIGAEIGDLISSGENPNDFAVVVRHIEDYGEMLEDVFSRYGVPHTFETGVPLLRIPFIKYWLAVLDLVTGERSREALGRVMSSAYFQPRLSPRIDIERTLAAIGYIDRHHLPAGALAARKNSPLTSELQRFESALDGLEKASDTVAAFLSRLQTSAILTERDRQAWRVLVEELEGLPAEKMSFVQFRKIASEIAGLRTIPRLSGAAVAPGLPRVRIMAPHSLGYREYRWIFAPGFADGEFPARSAPNPLLPDETVEAINTRIKPRRVFTARDRNRKEPLYLFMILDSAMRRVTLTYPGSTLEGATLYPSVYIREIARHFEKDPVLRPSPGAPRGEGERLSSIADAWRDGLFTDHRANQLLGADIVARVNLERKGMARAQLGKAVFAMDGVWHPSELNSLSTCPFVFLVRHRLKLKIQQTPDFEVPVSEIGILAHEILRDFYSQPVPSSVQVARARMDEIVMRRLSTADVSGQGPYTVFDPSLWKIRRRQLLSVLNEYVTFAVRDAADGFRTQMEYLDAPLPSSPLGTTQLAGRPDHVAVHRSNGEIDAIRIDDFKYSAASGNTMRQLKESFQIPVYAWLAVRALGADPGVRIEGRYLLLRSPSNPVVSHSIDTPVFDEVRSRVDSLVEKVRDGRLQPDPADKQDCFDCDFRRLCRLYGS
jgi:hypothetical protein